MALNSSSLISPALTNLQISNEEHQDIVSHASSNLDRSVYCMLGIPIDAINLNKVVQKIEAAAVDREVLVVSTPNLNFLVNSLSDPEFRESVLNSDLCPPDGASIIWIARLLGLPIKERAAGADLLERLKHRGSGAPRLAVFLFGGAKGVAAAAAGTLNARPSGLTCVGAMDPGFGDVTELSNDHMIDAVNSSGADFLVLSLGAKKGQSWLRRNHNRLTVPIRSHLGAAINFQAGTIKRAPPTLRTWGFEWLWRIKEERYLWKRYRDDGLSFVRLLLTRVLPLAIIMRWQQVERKHRPDDFLFREAHDAQSIKISLGGVACENNALKAARRFQEALTSNKDVVIDLSDTRYMDARFMGLLLMLRKELGSRGKKLKLNSVPPGIERIIRLNELGFMLNSIIEADGACSWPDEQDTVPLQLENSPDLMGAKLGVPDVRAPTSL